MAAAAAAAAAPGAEALSSPAPQPEDPQAISLASAQAIVALLRKYRSQYSLQHAPLVFIYGIVRAAEAVASFSIPEELAYLLQALDECDPTWRLARNVKERLKECFQRVS